MKAEHRKELQRNTLAQTLNQAVHGIREGPSRNTVVLLVVVAVAVVLVFAWRWFYHEGQKTDSARWMQWDDLATPGQLESFLKDKELEGTPQARLARFLAARRDLLDGLRDLGATGPTKATALENVRKAAGDYDKLADESADRPLLRQEALLNAAKAYEALGEYDTAKQKYGALEKEYPDSARGRAAKARLAMLDDPANAHDLQELKREYATPPAAAPGGPPLP
jgi:tetratricopeptide (TPR) repeat protein